MVLPMPRQRTVAVRTRAVGEGMQATNAAKELRTSRAIRFPAPAICAGSRLALAGLNPRHCFGRESLSQELYCYKGSFNPNGQTNAGWSSPCHSCRAAHVVRSQFRSVEAGSFTQAEHARRLHRNLLVSELVAPISNRSTSAQ
jgi:hypothetical protein